MTETSKTERTFPEAKQFIHDELWDKLPQSDKMICSNLINRTEENPDNLIYLNMFINNIMKKYSR